MEVQQRFPGLARRFELVGVPGPISDSCVFIMSKRDELLKASLCILLRDSFKSHWDAASKECRTEYPKLAAELHASWCCWRIMRQLGFDYTWEQVKGTGNHTERLDFLEDLLECVEEFVEPPAADEQQQQVRLMAATSERFAALCNSNVQLFDSEFAQLIQEKQQAHAASDAYIHSIEATAQQMRENISKLQQQVHPVPGERWQAVFNKLQASHTDFLDVAKVSTLRTVQHGDTGADEAPRQTISATVLPCTQHTSYACALCPCIWQLRHVHVHTAVQALLNHSCNAQLSKAAQHLPCFTTSASSAMPAGPGPDIPH